GSLHVAAKDYAIDGTWETSVLSKCVWGVELGDTQRGFVNAKDVPLQILRSLVATQIAGIYAKVELYLMDESTADRQEIAADFALQNGALQIPSLGQQFRDIDLKGKWQNGAIVVDKATFSGSSGRGLLKAKALMENLKPVSAAVHLKVERN